MKRKYEAMIVLNTTGAEAGADELVSQVSKEIEEEGAKLDEIKQMGRRKFAYNAQHLDGGHYVNYYFEIDSEKLDKVESRLKSNDSVFLQHYQRLS